MAKKLIEVDKAAGEKTGEIFWMLPENLTIVGWDVPDVGHPLKDSRARRKADLDDPKFLALVDSIDTDGVLEPIEFKKYKATSAEGEDVEQVCVVFGKRRTKASRIVNERRAEVGKPPIVIPCIPCRPGVTEAGLKRHIGAENTHRDDNTAIEDAEWIADYLQTQGDSEQTWAEIVMTMGKSKARCQQLMKLLEGPTELLKAVRSREVSAETAIKLLPLGASKIKAELAKAKAEGRKVTSTNARAKGREAKGQSAMPTIGERRDCYEAAKKADPAAIAKVAPLDVLRWTLGECECPFFTAGAVEKPKAETKTNTITVKR